MPLPTDQEGQPDSLLNLDPVFQEGSAARKRSPKGRKKKRKDPSPPGEDEAATGKGGSEGAAALEKELYVQRHPGSPAVGCEKEIDAELLLIPLLSQDTTPFKHSSTATQDSTFCSSTTRRLAAS